jgi:hypothetical protein
MLKLRAGSFDPDRQESHHCSQLIQPKHSFVIGAFVLVTFAKRVNHSEPVSIRIDESGYSVFISRARAWCRCSTLKNELPTLILIAERVLQR